MAERERPTGWIPAPPEIQKAYREQVDREVLNPVETEKVEDEFREQIDLNLRRDPIPGRPDFPEGPA